MAALTFQSKVAIVTGCSSGIGLSTTLSFLSHGAKVLGIDVASFDHSIPEDLKSSFVFHQADLTLANAISDAITACKSNFGPRIDILINGAGVGDGFSSADAVTNGEWDRVISINLSVPVKLMRAVLPSMVEHQHGAIVNICSRASDSGATAGIAYTASKHGLVSLPWMDLKF
jgi:NAD(P)-dependent dehydrogenase (short-subunit alcohol dehydrogenase family)